MSRHSTSSLASASACLLAALSALGADWPAWRGDGSGISTETSLPVRWDVSTNIAWKTALPGKGKSSPVISASRIFLTVWEDKGRTRSVLCLDARSGRILWRKDFAVAEPASTNVKNGYASPTPCADGKRVYAFFDAPGLVALDLDGKVLWTRPLGPFKTDWGIASSPILCDGTVVQCCDHDGESFIVGVDAATGEVRWRTARPDPRQYGTPLLIDHKGTPQIVANGKTVAAYDPATGKELWRCRGMKHLCSPSAAFAAGLVYAASGRNGPAMAIDPSGRGDVTETHVRWFLPIGGPYVISPIVYPLPCLPGDNGQMRFIDAQGTVVLDERVRGHFTASPVAAEGRIYWTNERGQTHVIDVRGVAAEKPAIRVLATNPLGERCYASPAIAGGRLFIRTANHLFCIAGTGEPTAVAAAPGAASFAELKKQYEAHPAAEGEEVIFRIEAVEALARVKGAAAVELLRDAALKDPHWDVSEAAAKALGAHGEAALPAVLAVFADRRPYLRVIAARHMEQWKAVGAVSALIKGVKDREALVRIHALRALASVASAHEAQMAAVAPALLGGLDDRDGVVRQAAAEALALVSKQLGEQREAAIAALGRRLADPNPLVARSARAALTAFGAE